MKKLVQITFTVEIERDLDQGDSIDTDILTEVALDQLNNDRDEEDIIEDCVKVVFA